MVLSPSKKLNLLLKSLENEIRPSVFTGEFYKSFKYLTPIFTLFIPEKRRGEESFHSFHEASITLTTKSDKDGTKKENYRHNIFHEFRHKNP